MPALNVAAMIPASIRAHAARAGGPKSSLNPYVVRPVARDPDATWRPWRWIAGLPALVDEADLEGWLAWAKPRVEAASYTTTRDTAGRRP